MNALRDTNYRGKVKCCVDQLNSPHKAVIAFMRTDCINTNSCS
jgi:hypothetical protein